MAVFASVLNVNVPAILVPAPFFTANIAGLDQLCTGSLNVAAIDEVTGTPEAPLAGLVLVTEGGVVSDEDAPPPITSISVMLTQSL